MIDARKRKAIALIACLAALWLPHQALASDYFVDARVGSDANDGSRARPWASLERASAAALRPGDRLLFARGSRYVGALVIGVSGTAALPIVVGAYGEGPPPEFVNPRFSDRFGRAISVMGSHVTVDGLLLRDTPTPPPDRPPVDWTKSAQHRLVTEMAAVYVDTATEGVVVSNCEFVNAPVGIRVRGRHARITRNHLHDAAKITEQWGAIAIVVVGPYNEVSFNRIENYGFFGGAFANDGAAVELDGEDAAFAAHHVAIHHNISRNTKGGFLEIAGNSHDVSVAYNVSDDVDKFVGTNGIRNLEIAHNTVIRTRFVGPRSDDDWAFRTLFWAVCWTGCEGDRDGAVTIEANIFVIGSPMRILYNRDNPRAFLSASHRDNVYWVPDGDPLAVIGQPLGPGERIARPQFADPPAGDFSPHPASRSAPWARAGAFPAGSPIWHAGPERR